MINSYFWCSVIFLLVSFSTLLIEKNLIPKLNSKANQPIYKEGPSWHLSKQGTPTMGGLAFLISITLCLICVSIFMLNSQNETIGISLIISLIFCLGNAIVGIVDDFTKLKRKENAGLTPFQKLLYQSVFAVLFLMARRYFLSDTTAIEFPFIRIDLGLLYYPLAMIILLGIINCANLTDGIDGLASSVAISIGGVFLLIGGMNTEIAALSAALIGGSVGFLLFNAHPAKIFMGDTGSLFLGSLTVCLAFSMGNPLIILFIGGVYVIEGISVVLQIAIYKATKKRLFKMAPLHHHLEKCGMEESRICALAIFLTFILSSFAILILEM